MTDHSIKYRWLKVKVWFIHWMTRLKLRPNTFHKSEIELAKINGKRWAEFFRQMEDEGRGCR